MRLILTFFCCFISFYVLAQDPLEEKMRWYDLAKPTNNLFVHFDKNVYANNENIWFTGYLFKTNLSKPNLHHILAVALIRAVDSTLILQKKYVMDNGIALGSMLLPDSILTGNYYLVATTNITINGKPSALFVQPITIKSNIEPPFKADMRLMNPKPNQGYQVLVAVTSKDGRFLPKATNISYKYGQIHRQAKTDLSGQLLINLPLQHQLTDPTMYVKLKYEKDSSFIHMSIPETKVKANVKFYPEGGQLVNGLHSKIAWEVKDQQNRPIALKAFLFKDQKAIDTIETDSYGIGTFKLSPEAIHQYTVKLIHSGLADSIYTLPKALNKGLVMEMSEAVVKDTLRLSLSSNIGPKLIIRVHNFKESFIYLPFDMGFNKRTIKIPLNEVPKGLLSLTLSDSLDRPLAERLFFAHYDPIAKVKISTDQQSYKQREKVTLKLKLNELGEEKAVVSIACVQNNRIELKKMTDIESYTYLNQELGAMPLHAQGNAMADKKYLEHLLLVKGWRRYTWQELQQTKTNDTLQRLDSLGISGYVTKNKKALSKAVNIGTFGSNNLNLISTSPDGHFELKAPDLFTAAEKRLYLFVNEKNKIPYAFQVKDDFITAHQQIAKNLPEERIVVPSNLVNTTELLLKNNEKTIRLKEIIVTAKNDDHFNYGTNACGDYVCQYNILNCPNHIGDEKNRKPVKGTVYYVSSAAYNTSTERSKQVYEGCEEVGPDFFKVDPVYLHKEFYLADYKDPLEPAFFSTLYWNYASLLTAGKETELSFYTSDISGKFKVIVQGLTYKGVVYAEHTFEVKGN